MKSLSMLKRLQPETAAELDALLPAILDRAYDKPLFAQKCSALFEHVYESYPNATPASTPKPV